MEVCVPDWVWLDSGRLCVPIQRDFVGVTESSMLRQEICFTGKWDGC